MFRFSTWVYIMVLLAPILGQAQILPREGSDTGLEELYDKFEDQEEAAVQKKQAKKAKADDDQQKVQTKELEQLSELGKLSPFDNIAVIQRRFLPKTGRFELSTSGTFTTNNAFFNNLGLSLQGSYHFTDKWSAEFSYIFMTSDEKPITDGLVDNQNISTKALVQPDNYYGASVKWSPFYGKMAWFQQTIIPYDFYITPGIGITNTVVGGSETTFSLGLGQLFALSKSYGVRWDFTWNTYQAEVEVDGTKTSKNHSDLILGVGVSFFIPEAKYR
jgi:outer membrane beta-barrel protein